MVTPIRRARNCTANRRVELEDLQDLAEAQSFADFGGGYTGVYG
jgi:hypothetical protein